MPKTPAVADRRRLQVSVTYGALALMDDLIATGLYGRTQAECAERLIVERLHDLLREGVLISPEGP